MRTTLISLALSGAALLAAPAASAMTCYLVLDRNDNVIYQDTFPPVDLSDAGDAERKAMRARNEHMIAMETDRCPRLELITGAGTVSRINLENMGEPIMQPPGAASGGASPGAAAKAPAKPKAPKPAAKPPAN